MVALVSYDKEYGGFRFREQPKDGSKKMGQDRKGEFLRRERKFEVVIKLVSRPDLHQFVAGRQRDSPQETIQVLDVFMRETPTRNYVVVGRSLCLPKLGNKRDIGDGLECWRGYYQSIHPIQTWLSLNLDVSATSFYQSIDVVKYVTELLNIRDSQGPLSDIDRVKLKCHEDVQEVRIRPCTGQWNMINVVKL